MTSGDGAAGGGGHRPRLRRATALGPRQGAAVLTGRPPLRRGVPCRVHA